MKYIITESQLQRLNEITVLNGSMGVGNSYENLISDIFQDKGKEKVKKLIGKYLKEVLGYEFKYDIADYNLKDYVTDLKTRDYYSIYSKTLKSKDTLSNLAYFLVKSLYGFKKLGNLEVYKTKLNEFYFFDPLNEICVGVIDLKKPTTNEYGNITFPRKTLQVSLARVDEGLLGTGVGKEMYLALLDGVDVLFSDSALYETSLNIWVNVLPKYVFVGGITIFDEIVKITPKTKIKNHNIIRAYFATKNPELIKTEKNIKESINESRLENIITDYFDTIFNLAEINWTHPLVMNDDDEEYEDTFRTLFYYGSEFDDDVVFRYYDKGYFREGSRGDMESPILFIEGSPGTTFNSYFGDKWHEPFKKWFKEYFGLDIKTIDIV